MVTLGEKKATILLMAGGACYASGSTLPPSPVHIRPTYGVCPMTAFSPANIPDSVTTVEQLHAWSGSILAELNAENLIQTQRGQEEPAASVQSFRFPYVSVSPERLIVVSYLPLFKNWRAAGDISSNGIAPLSPASIPAIYLT